MFNTASPYSNDSTESLIETRYLSASGRDSAPASPMSSTFFDHPDILARSISPVPSNYAVYARSRPTSTDSSFLDFQAFSPSRLQLATSANNSSLMEKVAEQLRQVDDKDKESQASSPVSDKASLASKQTTRSRMVRRSDPVEPIVEGDQVDNVPGVLIDAKAQEAHGQVEKKKSKRFFPKFFRRALSTSGALNAQILDRSTAPSKPGPGPRPLASSTRANTSPAAFDTASISTSKTKAKSPSLFRFKHKAEPTGKSPTESTTPAIPSPPSPGSPAPLTAEIIQRRRQVRRSGSFAGFSSSGFAAAAARPKSPVVFDSYAHHPHMGVTTNEDNFEDELDALTLEAAALSAQIGRRWMYAEDRI
ncbi:hypothetical protein F5878DRAFT_726946 [Lentinula raphanica]|uniref:Uncharacterized protein n=1 Tax=Lentinula raphanica TaxID=153919 RepID=A0AA38UBN7_9AGAR|nr:hypothetical protein F5878DRAFT_726946 [Lentinula raphanica]